MKMERTSRQAVVAALFFGAACGSDNYAANDVDASAGMDAPTDCALPTVLTFGYAGAFSRYSYVNELDTSGIVTITRSLSGVDAGSEISCAYLPPPCGTAGVVTAGSIAVDLADADVRAGLAASSTPLYGRAIPDQGVYSIAQADGHALWVGSGSCSTGSADTCRDIPVGIQRLVTDLKSLSSTTLADPACQALNP
jgi:hypothetical protein